MNSLEMKVVSIATLFMVAAATPGCKHGGAGVRFPLPPDGVDIIIGDDGPGRGHGHGHKNKRYDGRHNNHPYTPPPVVHPKRRHGYTPPPSRPVVHHKDIFRGKAGKVYQPPRQQHNFHKDKKHHRQGWGSNGPGFRR